MIKEEVVLVNEKNEPIGTMEKMEAHEKAMLHRAFSVFVFNSKGEMLLQQRALSKYHSAGLWTNTCCSHPRPGEETLAAANRRLMEEMGLRTELFYKTSFIYKAAFDNQLTEYEYDLVYTGVTDEEPLINRAEVETWRWVNVSDLKNEIAQHPENFTAWFKIAMAELF